MEYLILGAILIGAFYLLIRSTRGNDGCSDGSASCDRCARVAQPPSDRRYRIELPDQDEKNSR